MRPCRAATAGREKFVTLGGSEPLLAKAAYELMPVDGTESVGSGAPFGTPFRPQLRRSWGRSEVVAAARAASSRTRWVSIDDSMDSMKEFLPPSKY